MKVGSQIFFMVCIPPGGIIGVCVDWVTGVDLAKGVTNWVCPDKVLICVVHVGPYIPPKGVSIYCGLVVALSLITLKPPFDGLGSPCNRCTISGFTLGKHLVRAMQIFHREAHRPLNCVRLCHLFIQGSQHCLSHVCKNSSSFP